MEERNELLRYVLKWDLKGMKKVIHFFYQRGELEGNISLFIRMVSNV